MSQAVREIESRGSAPSLYSFQEKGVKFLQREGHALLADAPRLGKAVQAINAAEGRTLIVAPAMVLEAGGWQDEAVKWRPDMEFEFVSYSSLNQRETIRRSGARAISKVLPVAHVDFRGHWDTLILDESHHIKERKALRTLAAQQVAGRADRVFMLTGTPIPNWSHELFTTLQILYPGDRRFTSYWRWIGEWFATEQNRYNLQAIEIGGLKPGLSWATFMEENLGRKFLRRTWAQAGIQMPEYQQQVMWVKMTPEQKSAYIGFKKDFLAKIREGEITTELPVWNSGAQTVKLAQTTTGLEAVLSGARGSGKLDLVRQLLEDYEGEPMVFFCWFRNTARALVDLIESKGLRVGLVSGGGGDRGQVVRDFQEGRLDYLVGTIATVSESLQLWRANICVLVERAWRPSWNEQVKDRLAFIGKTHPVTVIQIVTEKTVDQSMWYELGRKTDEQIAALTAGQFAEML